MGPPRMTPDQTTKAHAMIKQLRTVLPYLEQYGLVFRFSCKVFVFIPGAHKSINRETTFVLFTYQNLIKECTTLHSSVKIPLPSEVDIPYYGLAIRGFLKEQNRFY